MAEIAFEALLVALETTPGTPVDPTHYANMMGTLIPRQERYVPEEARGSYVARYRSKPVRWWGELAAEGPLDVYLLPLFLNMAAEGNVTTPTTPGGGTNSRLWEFVPTNTEDTLEKATFWWGERNTQMWYGTYGHLNELRVTNDASSTDGATMSITGRTRKPAYESVNISGATATDPVVITSTGHGLANGTKIYIEDVGGMVEINGRTFTIANQTTNDFELVDEDGTGHTAYTSGGTAKVVAPAFPAQLTAPLIIGQEMQMWLDTGGNAIGTTAVTGRLISAEHVLPVGYVTKYLATGPGSDGSFTRLGRPTRSLTTTVKMELLDLDQIALFENNTTVKLRIRHNGPLIESSLYHYLEVDTYGPLVMDDWTDLEGTNRAVQFTVTSEYDSTLGADWRIAVQNDRTTL